MTSQAQPYDALRSRLAQGWTAMFFMVLCGFLADLIKSAAFNDFTKWDKDPGYFGLHIVSVVMTIYIFMPMLIRAIDQYWFRWTVVVLTAFFSLFFVAHQVAHALTGTRPFDIIHIFDFGHHILGIWVITLAARWARQESPELSMSMPSMARQAA